MRLASIFLSLLAVACLGAPASAQTVSLAPEPAALATPTWECDYVVTVHEIWLVRCYDPAVLVTYDAAVDQQATIIWDIPLWGPPMSAERTAELVAAVLCTTGSECAVHIAAERTSTALLLP